MTLIHRNSRWGVKVWNQGQRKYVWVGTFSSEQEALQAEADATLKPGKDTPTVQQWGRVWLSDYPRAAASTQRTYRYAVEQISKALGARRLGEVGRREARQVAKDWPRGTTRVAAAMWADAVRDEMCELNPWTNLRIEGPRGRKDIDALTEAEVLELADLALEIHRDYGPEARAIILTLAYTGVRPGELCALRRDDVDLERGEVTVRLSLDAEGHEKAPKNGLARRIIVPPVAVGALRDVPRIRSEYLLHSKRGHRLRKDTLALVWRETRAAWVARGGKSLDLYELRHAAATMMIERGLSAGDVAFQLGHQDGGRLVQSLYGHPAEEAIRDRIRMAHAETPSDLRRAHG